MGYDGGERQLTGVEPGADAHHIVLVSEGSHVRLVLGRGQVLFAGTRPSIPRD